MFIKGNFEFLVKDFHFVKSVRIRSYSGPHFRAFGLNTERYGASLRIHSDYRKMGTRITLNADSFHALLSDALCSLVLFLQFKKNVKNTHGGVLLLVKFQAYIPNIENSRFDYVCCLVIVSWLFFLKIIKFMNQVVPFP